MKTQEKADIKLAYQTAAELTLMVAIGLSQVKQNHKKKKFISKQLQRLKSKRNAKM